jgi:gas vesicle protein
MQKRDMFIVGLISGAVLGGLAALLLAPKTGKETRRILKTWAGNLWRGKTGEKGTKDAMGSSDR